MYIVAKLKCEVYHQQRITKWTGISTGMFQNWCSKSLAVCYAACVRLEWVLTQVFGNIDCFNSELSNCSLLAEITQLLSGFKMKMTIVTWERTITLKFKHKDSFWRKTWKSDLQEQRRQGKMCWVIHQTHAFCLISTRNFRQLFRYCQRYDE